jgi:hypothetical protein
MEHANIGDINAPKLIRMVDDYISQEVRIALVSLMGKA